MKNVKDRVKLIFSLDYQIFIRIGIFKSRTLMPTRGLKLEKEEKVSKQNIITVEA